MTLACFLILTQHHKQTRFPLRSSINYCLNGRIKAKLTPSIFMTRVVLWSLPVTTKNLVPLWVKTSRFAPYFASAIQGNNTQYVALGARSNVRGYFLSSPLYVENDIVGVITVKVSLENLENILTSDDFEIVVLDSNQVVFLSSQAPWLYHSLLPLTQQQQTDIALQRQYGQSEISIIEAFRSSTSDKEKQSAQPNNIQKELTTNQLFKLGTFNLYPAAVSNNQYQVVALKETRAELIKVLQIDVIFVVIYSLMMLIAWSWRQTYIAKVALTRLNQNLEQTVDKRTHYFETI